MTTPEPRPAPDLRTERDRTSGAYRPPDIGSGEFRNIYRGADGSTRRGPVWRDRTAAGLARETLPGETFVECRDVRSEQVTASNEGHRS